MQPKTLILMVVALVAGLAAAMLTANMRPHPNQRAILEAHDSGDVQVVVARKDILSGTQITEPQECFKYVHYRKGDEPMAAVLDLGSLKGKVVKRALAEDQPVKEKDLAP